MTVAPTDGLDVTNDNDLFDVFEFNRMFTWLLPLSNNGVSQKLDDGLRVLVQLEVA